MEKINIFQNDIQALLNKTQKPIVLVGMMGAGKSHIGRALSEALDLPLYDSDKVIEDKAQMAIPDIFENFGEAKFREVEAKTINELLENAPCIIATGGGALTNSAVLETLKNKSILIWLNPDIETLWKRVKDSDRPLLQTKEPKQTLKNLLEARENLYAQAHIQIADTTHQTETVERIIQELSKFLSAS